MNKVISLTFLIIGLIMILSGISAADSLGSDISRFFTGSPTDKSIWMLIGGVVFTVVGLSGVVRGPKAS